MDFPADLPDPVRRYFGHALGDSTDAPRGIRLRMRGRIKVRRWLPFSADWEGDGRSFDWRARAGPARLLHVRDRFAGGQGSIEIRLFGRLRIAHSENEDTTRSAAGRAALEAVLWSPATLLPSQGVAWRAESAGHLVASWDVAPERPEVHVEIDEHGAVRSIWALRWNDGSEGERGRIPFGGDVLAERTFGSLTLASRVSVGWWYGTPRYDPFFEAEIESAAPV
jgi:uncharacterized protein DUF6544